MSSQETLDTDVQVLELSLGDSRFAIDIEQVDEIVERTQLTSIPNSPSHVAGLMDLRGQTTRIIDPKEALDVASEKSGDRVIILDIDEESQIGWIVDAVYQVFRVDEYGVENAVDSPAIQGIIKREEEFVMWIDPLAVVE